MLSSLITEPSHSIIRQSFHSRERKEPLNGDGFGVGWYAPEESDRPAVFKDVTPAWNNQNLANLAAVVRSDCIVAHVRAASPGLPVHQLNCHPFAWQRFLFAHNGAIAGFSSMRRHIQALLKDDSFDLIKGSTDSEHLFALFAHFYEPPSSGSCLDAMARAVLATVETLTGLAAKHDVRGQSQLNIALTNGAETIVTRYTTPGPEQADSLYVHTGAAYECVDGVCTMRDFRRKTNTVLVASEPLSTDTGWRAVTPDTMLLIAADCSIDEQPLVADVATAA